MQISGTSISPSVSVQTATLAQAGKGTSNGSDQAEIKVSADSFSSLVKAASAMPEVRSEVVDSFKARIQSGHYPSQEIVAGLIRLVGGPVSQQMKSAASSQKK